MQATAFRLLLVSRLSSNHMQGSGVPIIVKDAEGERVATYVHSMPARAHLEQVGLSCRARRIVSCVMQ